MAIEKTGWATIESCPRDREVTLWATHLPTNEGYREIRGYFNEPNGWVASDNDGHNFVVLYPTRWLPSQ
jgi:hypothetical protein